MRLIRAALAVASLTIIPLLLLVVAHAGYARAGTLSIRVVYPGAGDTLPYVRHSFVFGSVSPGSTVRVNGTRALVAASGGWIAYVPFEPGAFGLHVVGTKGYESVALDQTVSVTTPLRTLPASPASVDSTIPPAPDENMSLQPGDAVHLFIKASSGASVTATIGDSPPMPLVETRQPTLIPTEQQRILGDMVAGGDTVGGLYEGELHIPISASGAVKVNYRISAADGSALTSAAKGIITVEPPGSYRVGTVVLADHRKDIDSRPYGIVESQPDGGWLFFPPAHTPFAITGSDGDYYRVKLGTNQQGWILKRSLSVMRLGTPAPHASVGGVVIHDGQRFGIVVFHLNERVPFSVDESVADRSLHVRMYGAAASTDFIRYGTDRSNIDEVRWRQFPGDIAAFDVYLRQRTLWGYHATWDGDDLKLEIKKPPAFKAAPASPLLGLLVVIDPGHSPDPGAIGPLGTEERTINLAIAKRLAIHLQRLGARTALTRTANVPVGLYDRTALVTTLGADVLVSVHNNALPDGVDPFAHHGSSVYYYQPQSLALARAIHDAYRRDTDLPDYGLYYDNLALARPTEEPAVLTESAFIMWPPEEMMLRDPSFQDHLGATLADGMNRWAASMRARELSK